MSGISGNWSEFESSLKKEVEKFHSKKIELIKTLSINALSGLQIESPVDTGRFRSAHDLAVNEPSSFNPPKGFSNDVYTAIAEEALKNAGHKLEQFPKGFLNKIVIFITNNVEYGQFIEDGSYSKDPMAPKKLYAKMAENLRVKIDEEIAKFKL